MASAYLHYEELIRAIGRAGARLAEIDAAEGAAGNISVLAGWDMEPPTPFREKQRVEAPVEIAGLAGALVVVTGAGQRLREIASDPEESLAWAVVEPGGGAIQLFTSPRRAFEKPTSEFVSHLGLHAAHATGRAASHAVVHAQPLHLTYLSHIPRYRERRYLNQRVARWQPECLANLRHGFGVLPFMIPGSAELMQATVEAMADSPLVVWAKHGVIARASGSVMKAVDLIEYVETGARYEVMNLSAGEPGEGLTDSEMFAVSEAFGTQPCFYVERP